MTKKELVISVIESLGYKPQADDEGDLLVRYQMKSMFVLIGEEDDPYLSIVYPQFHEIEEGEETLVLTACNKVTREVRLAKVYIDQTLQSVSASCEFFYTDEESLKQCIDRSLHILGIIRTVYRQAKRKLSE